MVSKILKAIAVSPGLAIGRVQIIPEHVGLAKVSRKALNSDFEVEKLVAAVQKSLAEMKNIISRFQSAKQIEQAEIFEAHALMIEDPELIDKTISRIRDEKMSAIWAYKETSEEYANMLASLDDEYLRERATDVRDIATRVLDHLLGEKSFDFKSIPQHSILVAEDVTPSQMAMLDACLVKGIITEMGGKTSHTAIIARALEIPALAGARGILKHVNNDELILIDALRGEYEIKPNSLTCELFEKKIADLTDSKRNLLKFKNLKSETKDKRTILLGANIGGYLDIASLLENDAEAVGLYRTEFVFLNHNRVPTAEEQYQEYLKVFKALGSKHCIIRTLDIGGDKRLEGLSLPTELNPFLGLRGVRLCLEEKAIFKDQLKSILRAALGHSVGIMIPMISNIEEIVRTKALLKECERELENSGIAFSRECKFGVMIEVPSAAMMVDLIARHVDFISIGTNDLTQYVCAVDRLNDKVEALYDPFNPGFLRVMNQILSTSFRVKLHSGICGSLAHSELLVPLFIGMGVDELSMTSQHILATRKLMRNLVFEDCRKLVSSVLSLETSVEIKAHLEDFSKQL